MSIQDSLSEKQDALRRHLFDKKILLTGRQFKAYKISKGDVDMYGDSLELEDLLGPEKELTLTINYPTEIPLDRYNQAGTMAGGEDTVADSSTFFFDILPVEIFSRFEDKLENNDYIIHSLKDEVGNPIVIVLKVIEQLGTLGASLTWRKHLVAPIMSDLPEAIKNVVDTLRGVV